MRHRYIYTTLTMPRFFAHFFSVVGHPLLVPTYALLLLLLISPFDFGVKGLGDKQAILLLLSVFTTSAFLPGVGIAIMKPLGFVKSLDSPDREDRTGPYIVAGVFYLWLYKNLSSGLYTPPPLFLVCLLGATIALFIAFIVNLFTKISAHATGMGGLVGMMLLTSWEWGGRSVSLPLPSGTLQISMVMALALVILLAGFVGTARLVLKAHVTRDIWQGYLVGFMAVWLAKALL